MGNASLSLMQERFVAAYIGEARGNATEAARLAGYKGSARTLASIGSENLTKPDIQEAIEAYRAAIRAEGIAHRQNRLAALNDRWERMQQVIDARAADDWLADVPGGNTGLIVKQIKTVKHVYEPDPTDDDGDGKTVSMTVEQWEAVVDTGLLKELREHEKQAAQEVGDWTERREVTGKDGGPIAITGIDVPLPVRDDADAVSL